MSSEPFNLNAFGAELDSSRRARNVPTSIDSSSSLLLNNEWCPQSPPAMSLSSSLSSEGGSDIAPSSPRSDISPSFLKIDAQGDQGREKPYPLCLLCLTRPPSAVLLPCCHLNLCHLCAPMLILRSFSTTCPISDRASSVPRSPIPSGPIMEEGPDHSPTRIPYNVLLARATANHPKSRLLAGGGYSPPKEGLCGSEMRGRDILRNVAEGPTAEAGAGDGGRGFSSSRSDNGRIQLEQPSQERGGAKCLVCREGVKGWLRVYTG